MANYAPQPELPVSEQAQIRRDKLAALQAEGRDPFVITKFDFSSDSLLHLLGKACPWHLILGKKVCHSLLLRASWSLMNKKMPYWVTFEIKSVL